jgi:hypothetical protein
LLLLLLLFAVAPFLLHERSDLVLIRHFALGPLLSKEERIAKLGLPRRRGGVTYWVLVKHGKVWSRVAFVVQTLKGLWS